MGTEAGIRVCGATPVVDTATAGQESAGRGVTTASRDTGVLGMRGASHACALKTVIPSQGSVRTGESMCFTHTDIVVLSYAFTKEINSSTSFPNPQHLYTFHLKLSARRTRAGKRFRGSGVNDCS